MNDIEKASIATASSQSLYSENLSAERIEGKASIALDSKEYKKIIYEWNNTDKGDPQNKTIHQLFQEQVLKTPDHIALVYNEQQLSFKQLNEKANQLAAYIGIQYKEKTNKELTPDTLIALYVDRSFEMIIAILAVLKAGGAYVPMDIDYPEERINYILEDTKAELVLSQKHINERNQQLPQDKVIAIDLTSPIYQSSHTSNLTEHTQAAHLAYVIYTSGTTGKPKGVMIEHRNVVNLITGLLSTYEIAQEERFIFFSNYVFDASVEPMLLSLFSGGALYMIDKNSIINTIRFADFVVRNQVTHLDATPSYLGSIDPSKFSYVKRVIFGAEYLSKELFNRYKKIVPVVINAYGPTEATITSLVTINSHLLSRAAIQNTKAYILDTNQHPVAIGIPAELYIGGAGVARGYLNLPQLTAESFIANPFATEADKKNGYTRLYKTGDWVRWLHDGSMEYIGRNDDQVKINGFRVELGEIERALSQIKGIKQSCVLAKEKETRTVNNTSLVAYYVLDKSVDAGNDEHILNSWEDLHDIDYNKVVDTDKIESDFSGWDSYITGAPISLDDMEEWRKDTVNLISSLNPSSLLEIGVGSGLLMYPLLNKIQTYTGLDISQQVIRRHQQYLNESQRHHATLYHLMADQLDQLPEGELYDTIIINSVCQYFPSIDYFENVIIQAVSRLSKHGSLLIGDIRNYDHHKTLIKDKLIYGGKTASSQEIDSIALKEIELLISPDYFAELAHKYEHLAVSVLERNGNYTKELSRYRYDVVVKAKNKANEVSNVTKDRSSVISNIKSGNNYNIPYLNQLNREEILRQLSGILPAYMLPSYLVMMEEFPLNVNGKLDKNALPEPDFHLLSTAYTAPQTEIEIAMSTIWQEVLRLDKVGITDNFFRIGGNSILAIGLIAKMNEKLDTNYQVTELLQNNTIINLIAHGNTLSNIHKTANRLSEARIHHFEQLMFNHEQSLPEKLVYIESIGVVYEQQIDIKKLKKAVNTLLLNNEILHSNYIQEANGDLKRIINKSSAFICEELTITGISELKPLLLELQKNIFDISTDKLIRFHLITAPEQQLLFVVSHHLILDATSMSGILLPQLYEELVQDGKHPYISNGNISEFYKLSETIESYYANNLNDKLNYWRERLLTCEPIDLSNPTVLTDNKAEQLIATLDLQVKEKIQSISEQLNISVYSVLFGLFSLTLSKFSGKQNLAVATNVDERILAPAYENVPGCFINNTFIISQVNPQDNVSSFLIKNAENIWPAINNMVPFSTLLSLNRELIVELADVHFNLETQDTVQLPYEHSYQYSHSADAKKGLYFEMDVKKDKLLIRVEYQKDKYDTYIVSSLLDSYIQMLRQSADILTKKISELSLLNKKQYQEIVYDWNATEQSYSSHKTIHELFQDQVIKTPDHIALAYDEQQLSYLELNEKSNQLARFIRSTYEKKTGVALTPDTLIALCLERSMEMVIGILAVLKAGGAYLPIDPGYPQDRIDYIINDSKVELILIQNTLEESNLSKLPTEKVLRIDLTEKIYKGSKSNLTKYSKAANLAYVIYTSGTTGKPKGAMLNHSGIVNRIEWMQNAYPLTTEDVVLQKTPYVFDVSVWELLWANWYGAKILMAKPEGHKDAEYLSYLIQKNKVTTLHFVPSMLEAYNNYLFSHQDKFPSSVRQLFCSGEALSKNAVQLFYKNAGNPFMKLHNLYGPTEASVDVTFSETSPDKNVYIGRPIQNTQVFILDPYMIPVPVGASGELYLGGAGLARGYLNRPELTNERFVKNPFATDADLKKGYTRLYKTGDLVRWAAEGEIEYLGRNDDQIKIRGYRIELGEIENALIQIRGVKQACILTKEGTKETGGNKYLVGYYIPEGPENKLDQVTLLKELSQSLPDYMIPVALIEMESFPLTINGKLDRRSFPAPNFSDEANHTEPKTELEITLCGIYAEILGLQINQVSTQKNFFRMGGNSMLSIRLKLKLNQLEEFKSISNADLFKFNSIQKLIQSIEKTDFSNYHLQEKKFQRQTHEIAIVGMSGAFSGVKDIADFWDLIENSREGIQFKSKEECRELGVDESLLQHPEYIPVSGQVKSIEQFDPLFWDMSPNEAKQLDPQIRKFIEHSWYALESSGYSTKRKDHKIGVFAGSGNSDYFYEHILNGEISDQINSWEASASNNKGALATKTAFLLGLLGPAQSINTACSTGLVSVIEACKNLEVGACDMALAGGVSFALPDRIGYIHQEGMILSKDGHCRTFDAKASGTTEGSGIGVVLLKRLEDAVKDGDTILSVIKGYATNNDGDRKTGYTAPSVVGQSECIINAQRMAGITADNVDYVECHGTATHLGDPIEIQALREAFAFNQNKYLTGNKTVLGSVKANIGHSDSAAGIASLIKVCGMIQHNRMPGQVNFDTPNAELGLDQTNFEIIKESRDWLPTPKKQRIAGVSSFGIGGTNAHVIVGDYTAASEEKKEIVKQDKEYTYTVPLSAKSKISLEQNKNALLHYLTGIDKEQPGMEIKNISYSLQEKREQFNYRSAYCVRNTQELISRLKEELVYSQVNTEGQGKIVFMSPGQGSQYTDMARAFYESEPGYRSLLDECFELVNQKIDADLRAIMYPSSTPLFDINETQWAQISLFITEYTLAKYLNQLGIQADAYIGHSIGEYVAATLCGVFSLNDAIEVVIKRGKLMQSMQTGSMLAVNTNNEAILRIIKENGCETAVINSSEDVVASGTQEAIQNLKAKLDHLGIAAIKLHTSHAYHSVMMEQASVEFKQVFGKIKLNKPNKYFISNLSGEQATEEVTTSGYWCDQLRNTVQFSKGIHTLSTRFNHQLNFIEVGFGKALCSFVNNYKKVNNYSSIQTIQLFASAKEAREGLKNSITIREDLVAKLWINGIIAKPNTDDVFHQAKFIRNLPVYQFDFQKCWLEKSKTKKSTNQVQVLSKEKWLNAPVWSAISNLKKCKTNQPLTKNALIFLREDQLNVFDFKNLFQEFQLVVVGDYESNIDNVDNLHLIWINPKNENHFKELSIYLKNSTLVFDTIVHCCSINSLLQPDNSLDNGFHSLLLIQNYLLSNGHVNTLCVLTNGIAPIVNTHSNSANGLLVGMVRNINENFSHLDARIIDIGNDFTNIHYHIQTILTDEAYKKSNELTGIGFGKLWLEHLKNIDTSIPQEKLIANKDIILITDGLSDLSLATALHISNEHQVKFILAGKKNIYEEEKPSEYSISKFQSIEKILANNSSVDIQCFDSSDPEQVKTLIQHTVKTYGFITGIIHHSETLFQHAAEYSTANAKKVVIEKLAGIHAILDTTKMDELKFIAFTSSSFPFSGNNNILQDAVGSYLDYAAADMQQTRNTRVISINWDCICNIPTEHENSYEDKSFEKFSPELKQLLNLNRIHPEDGAGLLSKLINQTYYERVSISKFDIHTLKNKLSESKTVEPETTPVKIVEEAYSETEQQITDIFATILGLEQISLYDDFFKIGGNSILAIRVVNRMNELFNENFSVADIFKHKNASNLKNILLDRKKDKQITREKWEI